MRIVVYPHDLGIGGSQINAIELAAAVQRRGHEVAIFGRSGPLNERICELGLEFIASPEPHRRPSPAVALALRSLISTRHLDVIHAYEWPPALEARLATAWSGQAVAVATVMSMAVAPFIPQAMPIQVGTEQILTAERSTRGLRASLLEPPVDLAHNVPPAQQEIDRFKRRWDIRPTDVMAVIVGRLATELKYEGLCAALDAFDVLARSSPVRLLLVGDGPARAELDRRATEVNMRHQRAVVTLTGELIDPRVAYAAADFAIGMGGSALRAMAFGLPVIVQGEHGFFRLLDHDSAPEFAWHGWYGVGRDAGNGAPLLASLAGDLVRDAGLRNRLGRFSRTVVENRYAVETAATRQIEWYRYWSAHPRATRSISDDLRSSVLVTRHLVRRRIQRYRGAARSEDFNAVPAAAATAPGPPRYRGAGEKRRCDQTIVYLASASWDGVPGTDRRLVEQLARRCPVLWIDPPRSLYRAVCAVRLRTGRVQRHDGDVPGVQVLHPIGPPGLTRPILRSIAWLIVVLRAKAATLASAGSPMAVIGARLPPRILWTRKTRFVHYVTDDFVAGASLMSKPASLARREQRASMKRADLVLAVSETLARRVANGGGTVRVLANGCSPELFGTSVVRARPPDLPSGGPIVGLVGQLNERIDLTILAALAESGLALVVIGPCTATSPTFHGRMMRLLTHRNVAYLGPKRYADLPDYLAAMTVGVTPYARTPFNQASCPLKTLEYLSAGLPVVSTMEPDLRGLHPGLISVRADPGGFVRETIRWLNGDTADQRRARVEFAHRHSWSARADELMAAIQDSAGCWPPTSVAGRRRP